MSHALEFDDVRLETDAQLGGRVTALRLAGRNLLTGPEVDGLNFGSTFWTSPQVSWGWPPLTEIDSDPYEASREGETIVMRGPTCPLLGVAIEKRFAADAARGVLILEYRIINRAAEPVRVAPWEITRVHPNGLTFFATGGGAVPPSDLPSRDAGGITWVHHDVSFIAGHQKLFADTAEGWIAHVDGEALFAKTFALVPRARHAPGEAQIEIYASSGHRYVEVEQQGACETLAAGEALTWRVQWWVRRLPAGMARGLGSGGLVSFVRGLVGARPA